MIPEDTDPLASLLALAAPYRILTLSLMGEMDSLSYEQTNLGRYIRIVNKWGEQGKFSRLRKILSLIQSLRELANDLDLAESDNQHEESRAC